MKTTKNRRSKMLLLGVAAMALSFGLLFSGCAMLRNLVSGVTEVETETSKLLMDGANELVLEKEDGIVPATFKVAFERKFAGAKIDGATTNLGPAYDHVKIAYQEKNYRMQFTGALGPDGRFWNRITSVTRCVELQEKAKEETASEN